MVVSPVQWCLWLYFINRLTVIVQLKVDLMVLALGLIRGNSFTAAITEPKCVLNKYFKDISMLFACQQVHMKLNMKCVCVFIFQLVRYEKIKLQLNDEVNMCWPFLYYTEIEINLSHWLCHFSMKISCFVNMWVY